MITIDGAFGEGGGQVLRTSLGLSLLTEKPFTIENIRANRKKPGLMRQHLTAVNAAAAIGEAEVEGNKIGSQKLTFIPKTIKPGKYKFSVGTAGSCTLVLQTVLPALMVAGEKSEIHLEGGTHNPFAPPYDFLEKVFFPLINKMGPEIDSVLEQPGFYPAGGGRISVIIDPVNSLKRIDIPGRGEIKKKAAKAMVALLPEKIAQKEIEQAKIRLGWSDDCFQSKSIEESRGPGNVITIEVESEYISELVTGFGEKNVSSAKVAKGAAIEMLEYLAANVPVGKHLADQILIPMAMAGGGVFRTLSLTKHTLTNMEIIENFLKVKISSVRIDKNVYEVEVKKL